MAKVKIVDDAIWVRHIEGDRTLREVVQGLVAGELIDLEVDGIAGRWVKMRDGRDGRPTSGIRPVDEMKAVWARWRQEEPRIVDVRMIAAGDGYLAALPALLSEWDSPEDDEAFRDL
jgi:hypothetical protein